MEELVVFVLQVVIEVAAEVFAFVPFDWPSKKRRTAEPESILWRCVLWLCAGCTLAGGSLLVFSRTLIIVPALRLLNLALAPIVAGLVAQAITEARQERNALLVPRNHFWQAFWFTLGLVLIRFAYASRT